MNLRIYLSGPITGDPDYKQKFDDAAKRIRERAGNYGAEFGRPTRNG